MMNIPPSKPFAEAYTPGVYFLYNGETLVYIGQSRAIELRLEQHRCGGKITFDRCAVIRVDDLAERLIKEAEYVRQMSSVRLLNRHTSRHDAVLRIRLDGQLAREVRKCADRLCISVSQFMREAAREKIASITETNETAGALVTTT